MHADMTIKEKALARTTPTTSKPGRYQPRDHLLAFLKACDYPDHQRLHRLTKPTLSRAFCGWKEAFGITAWSG